MTLRDHSHSVTDSMVFSIKIAATPINLSVIGFDTIIALIWQRRSVGLEALPWVEEHCKFKVDFGIQSLIREDRGFI